MAEVIFTGYLLKSNKRANLRPKLVLIILSDIREDMLTWYLFESCDKSYPGIFQTTYIWTSATVSILWTKEVTGGDFRIIGSHLLLIQCLLIARFCAKH